MRMERIFQAIILLAVTALIVFAAIGCQPAYADEIPTHAKSYQRTLIPHLSCALGLRCPGGHLCGANPPGKPLAGLMHALL